MKSDPHQKVQASHLKRNAYLYSGHSAVAYVLLQQQALRKKLLQ
jgi:hypothetical protein